MKTRVLVKMLLGNGWEFVRSGGNHDIYKKGKERESMPRHREIDEGLARLIIARRGLK